jgi:serine/threonine protein kinase
VYNDCPVLMLVPETILQNRYRIVRQLGQGGMGTVFEAVDQRLDTTVALKETLFADERLRKQFEREARLLARLHHPALPRVSDHFSEGEGQFLVMQYIAGEDLSEMITRRRGPFPPDQVLTWADQLLDALDYLHTQEPQIIHRDIKPQNLKLTSRGQIILLDFGLAKGQASEVSRVTTSASIFGYTPNYAPLEQVQGLGTDPRSDIYSLAATLYHLITGEKPPDALTRAAAIVNGQPDPLKPAHEVNGSISAENSAVLSRAMAQNREQRYPTAAAMRRALQGSEDAVTVASRTEANTVLFPPSAPTVAPTTQANPNQPTVAPLMSPATVQPGETTVVRPAESPGKGMAARFGLAGLVVFLLALGGFGFYAYRQRQSTQNSALPVASPTSTPAVEPSQQALQEATPTSDEMQVDEAEDTKAERAAVKKEKDAIEREKTANKKNGKKTDTTTVQEVPEIVVPDIPEAPEIDVPNAPAPRRGVTRRQFGGVTIRTFPDGTQVITQRDGTRVMIRPDGTRQVLSPGQRRRRVPPAP